MPGVLPRAQPRVRMKEAHELVTTGTPKHHDIPCATVLTAYSVLPGDRLFCHRRRRNYFRQLDSSVAAPGPHDFAVRNQHRTSDDALRPSHPAPDTRDDREAPLWWARDPRRLSHVSEKRKSNICPRWTNEPK